MRKLASAILFLAASAWSFGQAIWSGTATISTSVYLNGSGTSADSQNVDIGPDGQTGQATFTGGAFGSNYYEFNFADGDETGLDFNGGANLRLYMNNQAGSSLSIPNGTLTFEITFPTTTTGAVTGVSVVSDTYSIFSDFSVTSNGAGRLTLTQIAPIVTSGNAENLFLNFTTGAAVPEPATDAAFASAMVLGAALMLRRRRSAVALAA